ncbi:FAD-dependent oxidoreductase [Microbulbifer sp. CnH-101-G]|uniref:FAD-dependent oxidoreductase n=1 Tax=Microbulbifer sp. CnH-101-G TaxID=3243393 RepID=UPI004039566A
MKVLIVGAGPTGLTLAVELARRKIFAKIIDKRDSASTLSRAVGITSKSLELLSHSGVSKKLIEEGVPIQTACIYRGSHLALTMPLHSSSSYFPTILGLPQDRTETILAESLASKGVQVEYKLALNTFREEAQYVVAQFSNGEEENFDLIIGADGVHSVVRQNANIPYPGFDLKELWSIADVEIDNWPHPQTFTLAQIKPGVVVVSVPIGKNRYRFVASCEKALEAFPLPLRIHKVRREGIFKISIRQARSYSKGRVHLAGDAAHCHSPVGGRGMNLGIADAAELARCIAEDQLDGYSALRHREDRKVIDITEHGRKIVTEQSFLSKIEFSALLAAANHLPFIKRRISRFVVEF